AAISSESAPMKRLFKNLPRKQIAWTGVLLAGFCLIILLHHRADSFTPIQARPTPEAPPAPAEVGIASYYGFKYQGRPTASGESFDMNQLTAAHPTHRFGTKVRVTNL